MTAVARLVTFVDVDDRAGEARRMSVSARHEAALADGRRVLLLDDRGWSSTALRAYWGGEVPDDDSVRDQPDSWAMTSVEEIEETTRFVVGPDEPPDGYTQEDMEADHWTHLSGVLRQHGVIVDPLDLKRLPHDVVLSERLVARVGGRRQAPKPPAAPEGR
jgi:hypothetical protein